MQIKYSTTGYSIEIDGRDGTVCLSLETPNGELESIFIPHDTWKELNRAFNNAATFFASEETR